MRAKERRVQLEEEDAEGGGEAIEEEEKGNWMEEREREREREEPEEEALGGTLLGVRILGVFPTIESIIIPLRFIEIRKTVVRMYTSNIKIYNILYIL